MSPFEALATAVGRCHLTRSGKLWVFTEGQANACEPAPKNHVVRLRARRIIQLAAEMAGGLDKLSGIPQCHFPGELRRAWLEMRRE